MTDITAAPDTYTIKICTVQMLKKSLRKKIIICALAKNMDSSVSQHVRTAEEKVVEMPQRTLFSTQKMINAL